MSKPTVPNDFNGMKTPLIYSNSDDYFSEKNEHATQKAPLTPQIQRYTSLIGQFNFDSRNQSFEKNLSDLTKKDNKFFDLDENQSNASNQENTSIEQNNNIIANLSEVLQLMRRDFIFLLKEEKKKSLNLEKSLEVEQQRLTAYANSLQQSLFELNEKIKTDKEKKENLGLIIQNLQEKYSILEEEKLELENSTIKLNSLNYLIILFIISLSFTTFCLIRKILSFFFSKNKKK